MFGVSSDDTLLKMLKLGSVVLGKQQAEFEELQKKPGAEMGSGKREGTGSGSRPLSWTHHRPLSRTRHLSSSKTPREGPGEESRCRGLHPHCCHRVPSQHQDNSGKRGTCVGCGTRRGALCRGDVPSPERRENLTVETREMHFTDEWKNVVPSGCKEGV